MEYNTYFKDLLTLTMWFGELLKKKQKTHLPSRSWSANTKIIHTVCRRNLMAKASIWCNLCLCLSNACPPLPLHLSVRALRGQSAPWVINLRQGIHGGAIQILISPTRGYLGPGKGARAETHTHTDRMFKFGSRYQRLSFTRTHLSPTAATFLLSSIGQAGSYRGNLLQCSLHALTAKTDDASHVGLTIAVRHSWKYLNGHIQI